MLTIQQSMEQWNTLNNEQLNAKSWSFEILENNPCFVCHLFGVMKTRFWNYWITLVRLRQNKQKQQMTGEVYWKLSTEDSKL